MEEKKTLTFLTYINKGGILNQITSKKRGNFKKKLFTLRKSPFKAKYPHNTNE
jgi:hypothetical protein